MKIRQLDFKVFEYWDILGNFKHCWSKKKATNLHQTYIILTATRTKKASGNVLLQLLLLPDDILEKRNVVCSINCIWVLLSSSSSVSPKGSVIPFPPLMSDVNLKNGNSIYSSSNHMGRRRRELNSIIAWHRPATAILDVEHIQIHFVLIFCNYG